MKVGKFSKVAMVVALMMGQITPPAIDDGYYEEDNDFNVVTEIFSGGWGWGLNKAYAECEDIPEASSPDECIEVAGAPLPPYNPDPWGTHFEDSSFGGDAGGGDTAGAGGGSSNERVLPKVEQCKLDQLVNKNDCYTIAEILLGVSITGCAFFWEIPIIAAGCGALSSVAYTDAKGSCDEQYAEEVSWCSATPP